MYKLEFIESALDDLHYFKKFVLAEIDDFNREIDLTRQNRELMNFLEERSKETKTFTINQVKQQLNIK